MNLTKKRTNIGRLLLTSVASVSMLGGIILNASSASAIEVKSGANLDRGISRISVDLRDFIKRDYKNSRVNNDCKADLNNGQLVITCDLSNYVEGEGYFPFSQPSNQSSPFKSNSLKETNKTQNQIK